MSEREKITREGKVLWIEREKPLIVKKEGVEIIEQINIFDPKFPQNLNEIRGSPITIMEGEGIKIDLSKREKESMKFWHRNLDEDEVIFVIKGRAKWHTELGVFEVKEGDIIIIPKGIPHKLELLEKGTYVALEIKVKSIKKSINSS